MTRRATSLTSPLLAGVAVCVAIGAAPLQDAPERPEPDRVVEIVAERFQFTPAEITLEVGTTVEFRLTSEDTDHGFRIVGPGDISVDIDVAIPKRNRGEASVLFSPTEPGEYRFECSRICGAGHRYMTGAIEVTPATRTQPGPEVADGGAR